MAPLPEVVGTLVSHFGHELKVTFFSVDLLAKVPAYPTHFLMERQTRADLQTVFVPKGSPNLQMGRPVFPPVPWEHLVIQDRPVVAAPFVRP